MQTMLELAGVDLPDGRKLDRTSLAPLLLDGKSLGARRLSFNGAAMRDGPWKLVAKAKGLPQGPASSNLAEDISERNNLAEKHPDRVGRMLAAIEAWKKDVAATATQ